MGITLAELVGDKRTITVQFGEESFAVTYDPTKLTMRYRRSLDDVSVEQFFADVVTGWGIDDVDPTDPEQTVDMPPAVADAVLMAVLADRPLAQSRPSAARNGARRAGRTASAAKG